MSKEIRATDPCELERKILDPNIAKNEAEWWARTRILELEQQLASREKHIVMLREALLDARSGWRYIREYYGDLYGVGWDRVEENSTEALAATADLKDCILCDAGSIGRFEGTNPESGEQVVWIDCGIDAGTMLHKARTQ